MRFASFLNNSRKWIGITCFTLLLTCISSWVFGEPVTTIRDNGNPANRLDLVILGDGYTASELGKYATDVETFVQGLFGQEPFKEYQRFFNVHRVDVTSNESGVDHPERDPPVYKETALDATYYCYSIQRLICVNTSKVNTIVSNSVPADSRDVILVIVNDTEYGGSGGAVAVTSIHQQAVELILHELGHTLGLLGDEYNYSPPTCINNIEPSEPNVTRETNRNFIKWNVGGGPPTGWIKLTTPIPTTSTTAGVPGLYEGARYCISGLYRPTYNSKMRNLLVPFEQINSEQLVKRFYNWVTPIDTIDPSTSNVTLPQGQNQTFRVNVPQPYTHSQNISWKVDDQTVGTGNNFTLNTSNLTVGTHTVEVMVNDPTTMVRNDPMQVLKESWKWDVVITISNITPMTWATTPYPTGTTLIAMVATAINDPFPPINYFFDFTDSPTGGTGGVDSGWQSGTTYINSGLQANHQYGYQVKARDGANYETAYSIPIRYVYTAIEESTGITFGAVTSSSIQVQSTNTPSGLARGSSGLLIENMTKATNSGWKRDNNFWTSSSLSPNMSYSFRAKTRNGNSVETGYSSTFSKYTLAKLPVAASFSNVTQNCIRANWTANGNPGGTQYYCENTTKGTNSGWTTNLYWDSCELVCGVSYSFQVKARNGDGIETGWTSLGSRSTVVCPPPPPPTNVQASDGVSPAWVRVTWTASPNTDSYTVYRATSTSRRATKVLLGTTGTTTYEDTTASVMVNYYYYVTASNIYGMSGYSAYDTGYRSDGRPPAPTNISASDGAYMDRVQVTWTASPEATSYTVYRATSTSRRATKVLLGTTGTTTYEDTTASVMVNYYYYVTASNTYGMSGYSAYDTGYRSDGRPPPPTNVQATDGTYTDKVQITWTASPDATSYTIYRATSTSRRASKVAIGTASETNYDDSTALAGKTYYYYVTASNTYGTSGFSAYDTGYR